VLMKDANLHQTQYQYDARRRLRKTIYDNATFTQQTYDGPGNLTSVIAGLCTGIEPDRPTFVTTPFGDPENPAVKQKSREGQTSRADFRESPKW